MNSVFGRSRLFFGFVGLLLVASVDVSAQPVFSLKAVAINGGSITPTDSISAAPGDEVTVEIFVSDWTQTGQELVSYQTGFTRDSLASGTRGGLIPLGWDRPLTPAEDISCGLKTDPPCPAAYPFCAIISGTRGICEGTNHDPAPGIFINDSRFDYVFINPNSNPPAPFPGLVLIDSQGPLIRYGALLILPSDAQLYAPPARYAGSFVFTVSDDACGVFNLDLLADQTEMQDQSALKICDGSIVSPCNIIREGLQVTVTSPGFATGECSCLNIIATSVPNCAIDGRQPTDPDGSNPQVPNSITFTFDCADTTSIASTSNFSRRFVPTAFLPALQTATPNGSDLTIALSGPMRAQRWNCIKFTATGEEICLGIAPGDVNSDGRAQSFGGPGLDDVDALVDCLNFPGTCTLLQCDMNQSGACGPQDLLREIDLLVGTGSFATYDATGILNASVPPQPIMCPSLP